MSDEQIEISDEERETIRNALGISAPLPEEKQNIHKFLHDVATAEDTTKVGNLNEEELGMSELTLRANKELALISENIIGLDYFSDYFLKKGEIITATSLSKDAKLINLAVMQKRVIEDATKRRKENKGWFKPKENKGDELAS